jgi:nucleotide-binding universal stress UspA family protein
MIRDICVVLDDVGERAGAYATSLAKTLDASLSGLCVLPDTPFATFAYAEVSYEMVASAREDAIAAARAASARFESHARGSGLAVACEVVCAPLPVATEQVEQSARLADLVVIEQPDPGRRRPADHHLDTVLLRSGRPALVVPYIQRHEPKFGQATVAWDGSATAARALGDALPLLRRMSRVEVVNVVRAGDEQDRDFAPKLARHLARHGIDAEFRRLPSAIPVAETILSHVADAGSDLLVMGAYGHSRLREALLGGASRGILSSTAVPVLMAH